MRVAVACAISLDFRPLRVSSFLSSSQGFSTPAGDVFFSTDEDEQMNADIRIYVADLAAYNAGHLHGVWIDATLELSDIWEQVKQMLSTSPVEGAEEFAIHDYEGFQGYKLGDYEGLDGAHDIAWFIDEYPEFGGELLAYHDLEEAKKMAQDNYIGKYTSLADYMQEYTEETSEIPKHLEFYID